MSDFDPRPERRKERRERKRLQVRFGTDDLAHSGYTQDISDGGFCLLAGVLLPPKTLLHIRIDLPGGSVTHQGVVRWSREYPPAVKGGARGAMGVAFQSGSQTPEAGGTHRAEEPVEARRMPRVPTGVPPEADDLDLDRRPTRRRQISTLLGNTFEVRETVHRGAIYIRIFRLPLTDGSHEAVFREAFWTREEADAAVKAFLNGQ